MTTVPPVNPTVATGTTAQKTLAGNFDTFLKLLTTQLQNQDPMSPMDSNQFTQQLVQFSQVEQQINTNDNLKALITQGSAQSGAFAVSYLGKAVTVTNGNAPLADGQAVWGYTLNNAAASAQLTVTNDKGQVVYSGDGETAAGAHAFTWDGKSSTGADMPSGTYRLTVSAKAADGSAVTSTVGTTGVVSEVDMTSGTPRLKIGPMSVSLSDIAGVQNLN